MFQIDRTLVFAILRLPLLSRPHFLELKVNYKRYYQNVTPVPPRTKTVKNFFLKRNSIGSKFRRCHISSKNGYVPSNWTVSIPFQIFITIPYVRFRLDESFSFYEKKLFLYGEQR